MNKTTLTKILTNSTFADTTIPYRTLVDEDKRLIAVANSFFTQWSGRHISMWSKSLLLYNLDTLEPLGFVDNLDYEINDLAFHPTESIIALGIGSYDGGAYYEGELLFRNYKTNGLNSILTDNREVTKCAFSKDGNKLIFIVNPTDDLDCPDYTGNDLNGIKINGIKDLELVDNKLRGQTYDPTNSNQPWSDFELDLETKEIKGGSFQEFLDRNEHLEVQENGILREKTKTEKKPWWKIW